MSRSAQVMYRDPASQMRVLVPIWLFVTGAVAVRPRAFSSLAAVHRSIAPGGVVQPFPSAVVSWARPNMMVRSPARADAGRANESSITMHTMTRPIALLGLRTRWNFVPLASICRLYHRRMTGRWASPARSRARDGSAQTRSLLERRKPPDEQGFSGGTAYRIRTGVTAVRGRRPRPLDECGTVVPRRADSSKRRSGAAAGQAAVSCDASR